MLTPADRDMIRKRTHALRHLKTATWLLPLIWLAVCVATAVRYPYLANPWKLDRAIHDGELGRRSIESLATMAPILTILVQLLVITFIAGGLGLLYREKRLLELVAAASGADAQPSEGVQ